jgi:hypothetical protein
MKKQDITNCNDFFSLVATVVWSKNDVLSVDCSHPA